jgi:hypothetical protein
MAVKLHTLLVWYQKSRNIILKKDLLLALIVATAVIVTGVFLGWENNKIVPLNADPVARYTQNGSPPLSFMSNWDGPDYLQIAGHGYSTSGVTNFFPLYPLLIHIVSWVVSSDLDDALAISWLCFVGAIYFYLKIIKRLWKTSDNVEALRGALLFILFPTGVFLLATYTESLFAFLALGAIYMALQKRYIGAGLFSLFATATHINGLFLLVLICAILIEEHEKLWRALVSVVIGSLGLVSYMVFLLIRYKNPLVFIAAQRGHGWLERGYVSRLSVTIDIFNLLAIILLVFTIIYWWNKRKSFSIYAFLYLCIPFIGGQFGGFNRYVLMAFPIQLMLYDKFRKSSLAYTMTIALSCILWGYFMLQYAGGYVGG